MKKSLILLVGGGTAGHISPLVAVLEELYAQRPDVQYVYVGSKTDVESSILTSCKVPLQKYSIASGKFHRFATWDHFRQAKNLVRGYGEAKRLLQELKPTVVFAKGGAVSVPIVRAAKKMGIPVLTHETDVVAGLANVLNGRLAEVVFTAYPSEYYKQFPAQKLYYVGQPVRREFYQQAEKELRIAGIVIPNNETVVTVIGGSQGAKALNELVLAAWATLLPKVTLVHITGEKNYAELSNCKKDLPGPLKHKLYLVPFLTTELPGLFRRSSVIVSRAGGTIAELAAVHAASIVVPLSTAAQNHQWENARFLQRAGAAEVFDELLVTPEMFSQAILELVHNEGKRQNLSEAIAKFDQPRAAKQIAEKVLSYT